MRRGAILIDAAVCPHICISLMVSSSQSCRSRPLLKNLGKQGSSCYDSGQGTLPPKRALTLYSSAISADLQRNTEFQNILKPLAEKAAAKRGQLPYLRACCGWVVAMDWMNLRSAMMRRTMRLCASDSTSSTSASARLERSRSTTQPYGGSRPSMTLKGSVRLHQIWRLSIS